MAGARCRVAGKAIRAVASGGGRSITNFAFKSSRTEIPLTPAVLHLLPYALHARPHPAAQFRP